MYTYIEDNAGQKFLEFKAITKNFIGNKCSKIMSCVSIEKY